MTLEDEVIQIARASGLSELWAPWLFEQIVGGVLCTGAVCPLITRGKNKGQPNYRKADRTTQTSVFVKAKCN